MLFRKVVRLRCPECDEWNVVPRRYLAIGRALRCAHCNAGLYVDRVRTEPDAPMEWQLQVRDPYEGERFRI